MDGLLLINKPEGLTSRDVVNKVSKILGTKKVGHTGTLDPIATGVLVLCIGKATKTVELITNYDKEYLAEVTLGMETDTLDITGTVLHEDSNLIITEEEIVNVLATFIGKIKQQVPKYSAVKVNGRKLYEYARNNIEVELPIRDIEIYDLRLIDHIIKDNNVIKFKMKCHVSKGTYIRSLIRDIGQKLNTYATMSSLIRTKQGQFDIKDCKTLDDINSNVKLINIKEALFSLKTVTVDDELGEKIKNGAIIDKLDATDKVLIINSREEPLAVYQIYNKDNNKMKPYIML